MLETKIINNQVYVKVPKAHGIWAVIQYWFWRSLGGRSKAQLETAMVDVWCKQIVTRRGDDGFIPLSVYKHELVHLRQIEALGRFNFCVLYSASTIYNSVKHLSFMKGYENNRFEVEARALATSMEV